MRRIAWVALACAGLIGLWGCGGVPPVHYYQLRYPGQISGEIQRTSQQRWIVHVPPFSVDAPYDQERIVYRVGSQSAEVGFYAYHRWAFPVGTMLAQATVEALGQVPGLDLRGPATDTRQPPMATGESRATLKGRLVALEEVDDQSGQCVRLSLELRLVDDDGQRLWAERLSGEGCTDSRQVGDVVLEMNAALVSTLDRLAERLQPVLLGR